MKFLENFEGVSGNGSATLLVGPMFSHLIGNLVLREIDLTMNDAAPGQYFRYVDDFVLVAPEGHAKVLEKNLKSLLNSLNLELHPKKRIQVTAEEWLQFKHSFDSDRSKVSWMTFVRQLKLLMLFRPECRGEMERKFRDAEIRIRPLDYTGAAEDRDYMSRVWSRLDSPWFRLRYSKLYPERIVCEGIELRFRYLQDLVDTLSGLPEGDSNSDRFGRKMGIHRIRFLLSRLGYFATKDQLHHVANEIEGIEEVAVFASVFRAMADRDVSNLLRFGATVAQSIAQPLRMDQGPVKCSIGDLNKEEVQAYAVLQLNGVPLMCCNDLPEEPIVKYCQEGNELSDLFESPNTYFRELACLHGIGEYDLHRWSLETAFDRDEEMAVDMIEMMQMSYW